MLTKYNQNKSRPAGRLFYFLNYFNTSYKDGTNQPRIVGTANENAIDVKSDKPIFSSLAPTKNTA